MNDRTFKPGDAFKLEDPDRLSWLPPDETARELGLTRGLRIADIGAGTGYFAIPFAREIAPRGRLYAVDCQREMLDLLRAKLKVPGAPGNIELREGTAADTGLPGRSCDLVFLANVWHELDEHAGVLAEANRILRPGGRIAILDWRTDVSRPPGPPVHHRIDIGEVERMLAANRWTIKSSSPAGPFSYLVVAACPAAGSLL